MTPVMSRADQRELEARVAHLPVEQADKIVSDAYNSPSWARRHGWLPPLPVVTDDAAGGRQVGS